MWYVSSIQPTTPGSHVPSSVPTAPQTNVTTTSVTGPGKYFLSLGHSITFPAAKMYLAKCLLNVE